MVELFSEAGLTVGFVICLAWAGVLYRVWVTIEVLERLPSNRQSKLDAGQLVSVVIAARDEEKIIQRSVESLLAQENVNIQIIVVDDGSSDQTLAILTRLAESDDRLLALKNEKVPVGWIGKNYALEMGQGRANGDFILFTDADVIHSRGAVQHALEVMQERNLDHLALHPRLEASTLIEGLVLPFYCLLSEFRFVNPRAADATSGIGAGVGAFNLVRAEPYRLKGTHARLRGAVLDDRALGRMMREDGGRGSLMRAVSQVRMRPYQSFSELYVGIRKGVLSSCRNSAILTFLMGLTVFASVALPLLLIVSAVPVLFLGHVPWLAIPSVAALVFPIIGMLRIRSMVRFNPVLAGFFPVGAMVFSAAAIHAAFVFGTRGTIEWRGRQYSRKDLSETGV
jgi:glycosyltransferase involved in cell wall biosynthesis